VHDIKKFVDLVVAIVETDASIIKDSRSLIFKHI